MSSPPQPNVGGRKPYVRPSLSRYGDLRRITAMPPKVSGGADGNTPGSKPGSSG